MKKFMLVKKDITTDVIQITIHNGEKKQDFFITEEQLNSIIIARKFDLKDII